MKKVSVRYICLVGMFMAMTIALSSFGVPVPGGHLYLCDIVICTAALMLNPFGAFCAGGIGSFLGDAFFYPAPMFVSLVVHGVQAVVISLIARRDTKHPVLMTTIALLIGAVIMVVGYTLGKIYVYSTLEYAIVKLPYEIAQALLGVIVALIIRFKTPIPRVLAKYDF